MAETEVTAAESFVLLNLLGWAKTTWDASDRRIDQYDLYSTYIYIYAIV